MYADRVEVSWDAGKSRWLVRIQTGEEVIRRHLKLPGNAEETFLRAVAAQMLHDDGYQPNPAIIQIRRLAA